MSNRNRAAAGAFLAIAAIAIVTLPLWANRGIVFIAGVTITEALFSLSWNLLFGFTGLATFGHAAFFGMGAYMIAAVLKAAPAAPFLPLLLASALTGGAAAAIVGVIALRRTGGIQLAILTLALSQVFNILVGYSAALGGGDGISSIPRPTLDLLVTRIDLTRGSAYYWFLCAATFVVGAALWWLVNSRFGRVLRCIRQDPVRAAFLGINVLTYRIAAFTISGAIAAVAGGLAAPWVQIVTPDTTSWVHSTQPILNSLLGGATSFWGPVVGTVLFAAIQFETRTLAGLSELVIGIVLLFVVLAAPDGLLGLLRRLERRSIGRSAAARPVLAVGERTT